MLLVFLAVLVFVMVLVVGCGYNRLGAADKTVDAPLLVITASPSATATTVPATPTPMPTPTAVPETEPPSPSPEPVTPAPATDEEFLAAYVRGMSDTEKLGQLVMFGFAGDNSASAAFLDIMHEWSVGNVILFGPNIIRIDEDGGFSRCRRLTTSLQKENRSEIPLLISTDVEGGRVTRFKWPKWPTYAATLGSNNDPEAAEKQFARIGSGLLGVGINTNLAPCLDVARYPASTFLGQRIISSKADVAASIGAACIDGLQGAGCLSIVKHFPGHGGTEVDSHEETPVVNKSFDSLSGYDLVPFQAAVDAGADGVMVTHISYPKVDKQNIASMSDVIIGEVLRGQMGFDGIVMSDDFRMRGLTSRYTVEKAAVRFLLAGGDLILCGPRHDLQKRIMTALHTAVADGSISQERLDESVTRILRAKIKYLEFNPQGAIGG